MKIIATTRNGYLLEASETEVANLCGYYHRLPTEKSVAIGADINISGMFDQLYRLYHATNERARIADQLRTMAQALDDVPPLVQPEEGTSLK